MASRWLLALPVLIALSAGLGALSESFPLQPEQLDPFSPAPALNGVNAPRGPKAPPVPARTPTQTPSQDSPRDERTGEPAFAATKLVHRAPTI